MLKELIRHNLKYQKAYEYVKDQLEGGNALSLELLKNLEFEKGQFFTLLPVNADLNRIYDFFGGCILPQNKTNEYINDLGKKSSYTWIPTLKKEIGNLVFEKLNSNMNLCCIFEDVITRPDDKHIDFFLEYGVLHSNDIYYLLRKPKISVDAVINAIHEINSLWHLVFILSQVEDLSISNKIITLQDITYFCKKIQMLVVGAYDGEGFVFWEPNSHQNQRGF